MKTPSMPSVLAKVLRTERHADAAKVHRVWVDAGDGLERHVWCGAFNMQAGDLVPLAMLGTKMPDGRDILKRGILGIDSEGMLCSGAELGVASDASGILILPPTAQLGRNVFEACRGFGTQRQALTGEANTVGGKPSRLECDLGGAAADLGVLATHDSGNANGTIVAVTNQQVGQVNGTIHTIKGD